MDGILVDTIELDRGKLHILRSYDSDNLYSWDFETSDGHVQHSDRWVYGPEQAVEDFEGNYGEKVAASEDGESIRARELFDEAWEGAGWYRLAYDGNWWGDPDWYEWDQDLKDDIDTVLGMETIYDTAAVFYLGDGYEPED